MTPAIWFVICMGTYQFPDFYINGVPFWSDKRRTTFGNSFELSDEWVAECRKFDDDQAIFIVSACIYEYETDYD